MATTKRIKELLQQARRELDDESRAKIEPFLRGILEAAKPEIRTQVEYRSDPRDKAKIETLQATLAAQDDELRKLRSRLAGARWEETHWQQTRSVDEVLQAVDKKARAFMQCIIKSMYVAGGNAEARRKKQILARSVVLGNVVLGTYLSTLESCQRIGDEKLKTMIARTSSEALARLAHDIHVETGIAVDLELRL